MTDDYRRRVAEAILALLRRTVPSEYDLADAVLAVPNPELEELRKQIAILDRLDKVAIDDWAQANRELKAEVARLRAERDAARATRDETHVWTNTDWKERAERAERERNEMLAAIARVRELKRAPGVHTASSYVRGQDDGWDQALAAVLAALDDKE